MRDWNSTHSVDTKLTGWTGLEPKRQVGTGGWNPPASRLTEHSSSLKVAPDKTARPQVIRNSKSALTLPPPG